MNHCGSERAAVGCSLSHPPADYVGQPHPRAMATNVPVTLETPIVVKLLFRGQTKKFKLPLKDLGAHVLPEKVRCSPVPAGQQAAAWSSTKLPTT